MLPAELVDQIFVWACRIPPAKPRLYELYAGLTGVADTAATTNLMCVSRRSYNLLAPLLYHAPLLVYPWQIARFDWTLMHNPSLAPLIEHIHMRGCVIFEICNENRWAAYDYESKFGVVPGAEFPLHSTIEYDAVELSALCGASIDPTCACDACGEAEPYRHWMYNAWGVRSFIAWLRCVAAYGARDAVSHSDIPLLEMRARDAAERLNAEYCRAADEKDSKYKTDLYRARLRAIPARAGTRFGQSPLPDIGAEMPALYTLHLDAYLQLDATLPRWLRLTAARALAYGRLKGADNAHAHEAFLAADHRWVWRDRDEAAEPWTAKLRDVPDAVFAKMPFKIPLSRWYSVMPDIRLSPRPVTTTFAIVSDSISRILAMATSARTVACTHASWLADPALADALPRLEKVIIEDYVLPDGPGLGYLSRVRDVSNEREVILEDLHRATRPGHALANVERYTMICDDGFVRIDRRMLDALTPAHVDQDLLRFDMWDQEEPFESPLTRVFGLDPELTEEERAFRDGLVTSTSVEWFGRDVVLLYLEWMRAVRGST